MKKFKIISILLPIVTLIMVASCEEKKGEFFDQYKNWEARNASAFADTYSLAQANADGNWKIIHNWSYNDSVQVAPTGNIIVHAIVNGTGSGCPLWTDSVRVHYEGRIIPTDSVPEGKIFDSSWKGTYNLATMSPAKFAVSGLIDGFSTALQNMHIGDRWKVYIPYTLGYGTNASGAIPAYSMLIFDITLVSYYRPGATVPTASAKPSGFSGEWVTK